VSVAIAASVTVAPLVAIRSGASNDETPIGGISEATGDVRLTSTVSVAIDNAVRLA
jgi:hypothetical protein